MTLPNSADKDTARPWYKEPWMLLVIGVPVSSMLLGIVIVTLAFSGKDSLVSDSYYKDGMAYTENKVFINKAKRLQIGAVLYYQDDEISVSLSGYLDDNPNFLRLQLIHPTLETRDETVLLQQLGDNRYLGVTERGHLGKRKLWLQSPEQEWMIKDEALLEEGGTVTLSQ